MPRIIKTKTLNDIVFTNVNDIYEWHGNINHRYFDGVITEFMQTRLGKNVELVIDCRDEFGCKWFPWMIEENVI